MNARRWKAANAWEVDCSRGHPHRRLVMGAWECSVRPTPLGQRYLWAVWLADWQRGTGLALSVEEAMYEAETELQRASGLTIK
jgi:hypothetical protein